ncbi:PLD nuclease N-terminal domain-containing protein [Dyadobacter sp. CY356]|uniref:PLD nuclease N-terminal domain-containing protein n=1 Tax=Dyadobacter sp. CY356 TaxID=2906442 RepID=UPI0038D3AC63
MPYLFTSIFGFGNQEIFFISCSIALFILFLWAIIDLMSNKDKLIGEKLIWLLVILFFPIIGTLIYLYYGRSDRNLSNNR